MALKLLKSASKFLVPLAIVLMLIAIMVQFTSAQTSNMFVDRGLATLQIYNVAISVPDIDKSVQWYEDKLGFRLQNRQNVSTGIEIALIEKNGFFIDLIHISGSENLEGSPKEPPEHLSVKD